MQYNNIYIKLQKIASSSGANLKDAIPFEVEEVSNNEYKVTVTDKLEPGEYAFIYMATSSDNDLANQSIFDFSVE